MESTPLSMNPFVITSYDPGGQSVLPGLSGSARRGRGQVQEDTPGKIRNLKNIDAGPPIL
jgi:hypothetical protein